MRKTLKVLMNINGSCDLEHGLYGTVKQAFSETNPSKMQKNQYVGFRHFPWQCCAFYLSS